jgi:hypothetical protein
MSYDEASASKILTMLRIPLSIQNPTPFDPLWSSSSEIFTDNCGSKNPVIWPGLYAFEMEIGVAITGNAINI